MAKNSIGQFIAALRKANGMTQQDVADRLHVSNKAVSRWERDECSPDLSVIPALAEMFGVTCDELLKGERILETKSTDKKEQKVEKQIKSLITRTLSEFKSLIIAVLAVAIIGLICMFGISYGFNNPVVGFMVMLLFEACSFVISTFAVNRTKDIKTDNELFEMADSGLISKFNHTFGSLSYIAFLIILAVVLLSLPFMIDLSDLQYESYQVYFMISPYSYFSTFFAGIVLILAVVYLKCKTPYIAWITNQPLPQRSNEPVSKNKRTMSLMQIGVTILASFIYIFAPYIPNTDVFSFYDICMIISFILLAANLIVFIIYFFRQKKERKLLLLPGIRNILFIPSAILLSKTHNVVWVSYGEEMESQMLDRLDFWELNYLIFALILVFFVVFIFLLIDELIKRYGK